MLCSSQDLPSRKWTLIAGLGARTVSTNLPRRPGAPPSPGSWLVLGLCLAKLRDEECVFTLSDLLDELERLDSKVKTFEP